MAIGFEHGSAFHRDEFGELIDNGVGTGLSKFVPALLSEDGVALGVVQLLPGTARPHARALGLGSRPDLFDPAVNLRLGARELAALLTRFKDVEPALAAYNAGENAVIRHGNKIPPYPETQNYVQKVIGFYQALAKAS